MMEIHLLYNLQLHLFTGIFFRENQFSALQGYLYNQGHRVVFSKKYNVLQH